MLQFESFSLKNDVEESKKKKKVKETNSCQRIYVDKTFSTKFVFKNQAIEPVDTWNDTINFPFSLEALSILYTCLRVGRNLVYLINFGKRF